MPWWSDHCWTKNVTGKGKDSWTIVGYVELNATNFRWRKKNLCEISKILRRVYKLVPQHQKDILPLKHSDSACTYETIHNRVPNMAATQFDWTSYSWNANALCTSPSGHYSQNVSTQQCGSNPLEYSMRAPYHSFHYTPDRKPSLYTDSWSYFTPLDSLPNYDVGGSNPNSPHIRTSGNMHYHIHPDGSIPTPATVSDTSISKTRGVSAYPSDALSSSPVISIWHGVSLTDQTTCESEDPLGSSCNSPATAKTTHSEYSRSRKRGRPRKSSSSSSCSSAASSTQCNESGSTRLPHTAIERKYREGMNAALKRLRKVVTTLPQEGYDSTSKTTRLSKSMIINGAIEYIESLERERALQHEVWRELLNPNGNIMYVNWTDNAMKGVSQIITMLFLPVSWRCRSRLPGFDKDHCASGDGFWLHTCCSTYFTAMPVVRNYIT